MAFRSATTWQGLRYDAGTSFDWFPLTVFLRFKRVGAGGSGADRLIDFFNAAWGGIRFYLSGTTPIAYCEGGSNISVGITVSDNVWYDYCLVVTNTGANNAKLYAGPTGGTLSSQTGSGPSASATTRYAYVAQGDATYYPNGDFDDFRLWTATLTEAEIERERARRVPTITDNLYYWMPVIGSALSAQSLNFGTGPTMTFDGNPSVVDGAPVSWGAHIWLPQVKGIVAPTLSLPGVQDITATSARPKVTLTW